MSAFKSPKAYRGFVQSVKYETRFVHSKEVLDFLAAVIATSKKRDQPLNKGISLWRAQRGFRWDTIRQEDEEFEVEGPYLPERMIPKAELVGEGRANTRGIAVLYLASNQNTALSEVRPWLGSYVSLAEFKLLRDCKLVDCSRDKKKSGLVFGEEGEILDPPEDMWESLAWGEIGYAFSRPVSLEDARSDYIPTQVLSEAFRNAGYDGVIYKSLLDNRGWNIVLFDLRAAEVANCCLHQTKAVRLEFRQSGNPYFIQKFYPDIVGVAPSQEQEAEDTES
jgi:hypothetical protein